MAEVLSDAVIKHLNLTHETIRKARKTVQEERKQVWCIVCTEERAEMIAKTHNLAVVTTGFLNDWGKQRAETKPPGTYRYG